MSSYRQRQKERAKAGNVGSSASTLHKTSPTHSEFRFPLSGKNFPVGSSMEFRILDYTDDGCITMDRRIWHTEPAKGRKGDPWPRTAFVPVSATDKEQAEAANTVVGFNWNEKEKVNEGEVTFGNARKYPCYRVPVAILEMSLGRDASEDAVKLAQRVNEEGIQVCYLEMSSSQFAQLKPAIQAKNSEEDSQLGVGSLLTEEQLDLGTNGIAPPYAFRMAAVKKNKESADSPTNKAFKIRAIDVPPAKAKKERDEFAWMEEEEFDLTEEVEEALFKAIKEDCTSMDHWRWDSGAQFMTQQRKGQSETQSGANVTRPAPELATVSTTINEVAGTPFDEDDDQEEVFTSGDAPDPEPPTEEEAEEKPKRRRRAPSGQSWSRK